MNAYFDTAIILKLYVQEATSPDAVRLVNECQTPYFLTPWQEIEARTALKPLSLGVKTFVTFDERQRAVAKLEGLTVKP